MVMRLLKSAVREAKTVRILLRAKKWRDPVTNESTELLADDLEAAVDSYRNNLAFIFEGRTTSYGELDEQANRFAHWALGEGLKAGDTVALFMENRPDYIAAWYGLSKIGVITALVNANVTGEALVHSLKTVEPKLIITGASQDRAMRSLEMVQIRQPVWTLGGEVGSPLDVELAAQSAERPDRSHRAHLTNADIGLYSYTSGTTGLPKAAKMSIARVRNMMRSFISPLEMGEKDRVYITLPLYHGTGGLCAVGIALYTGASILLREKFSASRFWNDCADFGVTTIVYIGELCRYLLNQPAHAKERKHKVRKGFGNGLRPEIWGKFKSRFNIPTMIEFYGSTEGNVKLMNFDGETGACGRIPPYAAKYFDHIAFVKVDPETETPLRDEDGRCIRAGRGETGEALGRIGEDMETRFEGYHDKRASEAKILRNVFEEGDAWFRTGDLMRLGDHGYIYFVDRLGDTYRWKGENVSTNEVADALAGVPGVETANVYGVPIPGTDGKAGMASITTSGYLDYKDVLDKLSSRLPKYAVPVFIREQQEASTTTTFKYRKSDLVKDGFDPERAGEKVWYFDSETGTYELVTPEAYKKIASGGVKF
jgi:fatty-acyl-CoA synthase